MSTSVNSKLSRREHFLPFAMPDVGQEELEAIRQVFESGWVTKVPGPTSSRSGSRPVWVRSTPLR